jgi:hypothetical protein
VACNGESGIVATVGVQRRHIACRKGDLMNDWPPDDREHPPASAPRRRVLRTLTAAVVGGMALAGLSGCGGEDDEDDEDDD